jgi:glycosyltransferase involved in cell wall biosynthesis
MQTNNDIVPLVSICCTAYNHEKFITQCLDGFVKQQTSFPFEILVHEDASTDSTARIVKEYETKYPDLFRCVYQTENQFQKQNTLISILFPMSRGKYNALCEGDDYWTDPAKLQKQVDFLEANEEFSLCFHDVNIQRGDEFQGTYVHKDQDIFFTQDLFDRHFIPTCSMVFRNNLEYPQWFHNVSSGDRALLFLISLKGKMKCLNELMGVYRLHEGGLSNQHFGIKKIYDTAYLLNSFNTYTGFRYTKECHASLEFEINSHYVKHIVKELTQKNVDNIPAKKLLKIVANRVFRFIVKLFNS